MDYECWPLGDRSLLLHFGDAVDARLSAHVQWAARRLAQPPLDGVDAIVPSYAALALALDLRALAVAGGVSELLEHIRARLQEPADANVLEADGRIVEVPTIYGGAAGPDLSEVAERVGLTVDEVIERHSAPLYRVAQVGFQPGFPYLLGLPRELELPRRASPRKRVDAGSVAMAGAQTGIYPQASPGGWHLLGRTPLTLFDPAASTPMLLAIGDRVRFVPIAG
jgi:KipI family sensor histidine kinase inhibitor